MINHITQTSDHGRVLTDHDPRHGSTAFSRAFAVGISLNLAFVVAEVIFGLKSNSLALLSDAGHNLSDVFGLVLAWAATRLSQVLPTKRRTYGWRRASIFAALINAVVLLIAVGVIGWEAILRLAHPEPVTGTTIIWVAVLGVLINSISALFFMRGRHHDLNIRGAYLHLAADAGISLAIVIAGIAIQFTGWLWLDPAMSLAVVAVITFGTWELLRESLDLSMDAVPATIDPHRVEQFLAQQDGVKSLHDLHIWAMSTTEVAMTVHLVMSPTPVDNEFIFSLAHTLEERFGVHHVTIQVEHGHPSAPCGLEPAHVV